MEEFGKATSPQSMPLTKALHNCMDSLSLNCKKLKVEQKKENDTYDALEIPAAKRRRFCDC